MYAGSLLLHSGHILELNSITTSNFCHTIAYRYIDVRLGLGSDLAVRVRFG